MFYIYIGLYRKLVLLCLLSCWIIGGKKMRNFEEVEILVLKNAPILNSNLAEIFCYKTYKKILWEFERNIISKEEASRNKIQLIKEYEQFDSFLLKAHKQNSNIARTEELRIKLNMASKDQLPTKELWLTAIECISLITGDSASFESCKEYMDKELKNE